MKIKEQQFETGKGKFLLVDMTGKVNKHIPWDFVEKSYDVKHITENEADEIIDKVMGGQHFQNYAWKHTYDRWTKTGVESLLSLVKHLGAELYENPYKDHEDKDLEYFYEQCTFYNPIILKLC